MTIIETLGGAGAARFMLEGVPQGSSVGTILLALNRSNLNFDCRDYFLVPYGVVERLGLLGEVFGDEVENVGS